LIYDISPPISANLGVWPGDTPVYRETLQNLETGDNLTLSTLHSTVHAGAHADAPSHYGQGAPAIHERPLDLYIGTCQVFHVAARRGSLIAPDDLPNRALAPRLLVATGTFPDPNRFNEDFAAFSPELVDRLHHQGVRLIGIDTPSVDPFASTDLPVHQRCLAHDMGILEGLVLAGVPEGLYELMALPLKLVGFDASPVRAVLRTIGPGGP
jgi:arylformamidase